MTEGRYSSLLPLTPATRRGALHIHSDSTVHRQLHIGSCVSATTFDVIIQRGYDIPATMALASAVGAATAMGTGAGTNVASAENVLRLLTSAAQAENGNGGHQPNGDGSGTKLASGNAAALQVLQTELGSSNRQ